MDDVDITLVRHIAGEFLRGFGQLCIHCGAVLDEGSKGPTQGWPPGQAVMAAPSGLRILEAALRADRDRSDEADCEPIVDRAG